MKGFARSRKAGQSLPLLAVLIVVIVAAVGLSVDVGNAYGQQRRVQNMANAGALAGMNSVLAGQTNKGICDNVQRTLAGNNVGKQDASFTYRVEYVFSDESIKPQMLCSWNGSVMLYAPDLDMTKEPPKNISRVQITMTERVDTYFARVVGRPDLTLNGNGSACIGGFGSGVYPIGVPLNLDKTVHSIYRSNGSLVATNTSGWGQWDKMLGQEVYLPVNNWKDTNPGTHVAWLDWTPGGGGTNDLDAALTYPGTLQLGFTEANSPDPAKPNSAPYGELYPSDWVDGKTGTVASASDDLGALLSPTGLSEPRDLVLPMYSDAVGNGSKTAFYVRQMGYFRVSSYNLNGGTKFLRLKYLGKADASPEECSSEAPDKVPNKYDIEGNTIVNRVYRTKVSSNRTYDIVVVMDTSGSMGWDWNNKDTGDSNERLNDAKKAVKDFVRNYDIKDDPDARMAFVTFGNTSATQQVGWSCADGKVANNCSGTNPNLSVNDKWKNIQTKADQMKADGVTPGPFGFEMAEDLLKNKRTPPAGKQYGQIVVFATDGVFNVCGSEKGVQNCPKGTATADLYSASYNLENGRPIWQAQKVAQRLKSNAVQIFVVGLVPNCTTNCFDTNGLGDMSSGSGYYYLAKDPVAMESIYKNISYKIDGDTCQSVEKEQPAEGASMVLSIPGNSNWSKTDIADSDGNWEFRDLEAGTYVVTVKPDLKVRSPESEDGLWRTYSRLQNELKRSETTQVTVSINPQLPDGSTEYAKARLLMPLDPQGAPYNACNSGVAAP